MPRKKVITDRRERIIQAADSLFKHYGVEKTTMEDISREAGIPRATIYLEFPNGKGDILMASIENYLGNLLGQMREIARESKASRLETLKQIILYNIMTNYDRTSIFQYDPANLDRYAKRAREEITSYFQDRGELYTELFQQASLQGEISTEYDFTRLAELVSQAQRAFIPPIIYTLNRDKVERDANAVFTLLMAGISKNRQASAL